ncbi:hypothetical protein ABZZ36_40260 [Actinacidiphila glaucinigra]|uniref:hypothetical protein n=1 Tax=Actinacidiphila glaucinigra TaxID=235986 RepID=UPI0033A0B522
MPAARAAASTPSPTTVGAAPRPQWFSLSYANYLALPSTLLQSMPVEWQEHMVTCLEEMETAFAHVP